MDSSNLLLQGVRRCRRAGSHRAPAAEATWHCVTIVLIRSKSERPLAKCRLIVADGKLGLSAPLVSHRSFPAAAAWHAQDTDPRKRTRPRDNSGLFCVLEISTNPNTIVIFITYLPHNLRLNYHCLIGGGHPMADEDTRSADTILLSVQSEFRRACQVQQDFLAWYCSRSEVPFAESLRRYSEMIQASEQWAASYRRISKEFPDHLDQLNALLLPIQQEICAVAAPPQPDKPRRRKAPRASRRLVGALAGRFR